MDDIADENSLYACDIECSNTLRPILNGFAIAFTVLGWIFVSTQIFQHSRNYTIPQLQDKIIIILFMIPFYSTLSVLSITISVTNYDVEAYNIVQTTYDSILIYKFYNLLVNYVAYNPEVFHNMVQILNVLFCSHTKVLEMNKLYSFLMAKKYAHHLFPFNLLLRKHNCKTQSMAESFLKRVKWCILQYFIVNPFCVLAKTLIELKCGKDLAGTQYAVFTIFNGIEFFSVSLSIYYLFVFYESLKLPLKKYNVLPKIICVKVILFFLFWQEILINELNLDHFIINGDVTLDKFITNVLICFEMLILSIVGFFTYSYKQFFASVKTPLSIFFIPKVVFSDAKSSITEMKDLFKIKRFTPTFVEIESVDGSQSKQVMLPCIEMTDRRSSFIIELHDKIEVLENCFSEEKLDAPEVLYVIHPFKNSDSSILISTNENIASQIKQNLLENK